MRELVLLTPRSVIRPFDCGDDDLNSFQYKNIGSKLLSFIKIDLLKSPRSAFRFLTVDAYSDAVGFYERNGFVEMQPGRNGQTSIMYFDMAKLR